MRGDVGLVLEFALGTIMYAYRRSATGSSIGAALAFARSVVACHYLALAVATILWRISPFHPLAKFPGYVPVLPFHSYLILDLQAIPQQDNELEAPLHGLVRKAPSCYLWFPSEIRQNSSDRCTSPSITDVHLLNFFLSALQVPIPYLSIHMRPSPQFILLLLLSQRVRPTFRERSTAMVYFSFNHETSTTLVANIGLLPSLPLISLATNPWSRNVRINLWRSSLSGAGGHTALLIYLRPFSTGRMM